MTEPLFRYRRCGGRCRGSHAFRAVDDVHTCPGPQPGRLLRTLARLVPWL